MRTVTVRCRRCPGSALFLATLASFASAATRTELNAALGVSLFPAEDIWEQKPGAVAERLGLTPHSSTAELSVWRAGDQRWFGLTVAEVLLRARGGRPVEVSVNVINKGDHFSFPGVVAAARQLGVARPVQDDDVPSKVRRELTRTFERGCRRASERLTDLLTRLLGRPKRRLLRLGGGRRRVLVWRWQGTALVLDAPLDEYVMLRVLPERSVEGQSTSRQRARDVAARLRGNVRRHDNGDVLIENIPAVDQGDKGYCAVASAERVLRYVGIPTDSHALADLARTGRFGGTSWSELVRAMREQAGRHGRDVVTVDGRLSTKRVRKLVDQGLPILWRMYVTESMETVARGRVGDRPASGSMQKWRARLRAEARETRRIRADTEGGHIRLIVGYNDSTEEVAYSDSWDVGRPVLWLTIDEANRVHAGDIGYCKP